MKDIHLVVILYVATLSVAFNISSVADFPTECPTDDDSQDKIVYLPHENDCTKFYSCYMGTKGEPQDCPFMDNKGNRLHFNPVLQVCDWPWSAGCRTTSTPTTSSSSTITSSPSFSTSSTSSSNLPTTSTLLSSSSTLPTLSSSSSISPTSSSTSRTTMTSSSSTSTTPTLPPNSSTSTSSNSPTMTISSSSSPSTLSSNSPTTPTLPPSSSTSPTLSSSSSILPTSSSTSRTTVISSSSTSTTPTLPPNSSTSSSSPPTSSSSPLTTPTLPPSSSISPTLSSSSSISPTSSSTSRTTVISSSSTSTTPTLPPNSSTSSSSPPTSSSSPLTTPTLPPSSSTSPTLPSSSSISPTSSSTSGTTVTSSSSSSTMPTLSPNSSTSSSSPTMTTSSSSSPPTSSSSPLTTPTLPPSSSTSPTLSSSSSISPTSSSTSRTTVTSSSSSSTMPTLSPNSSTSSSSPTMTTSSSSSPPTSSSSPLTTPTLPPSSSILPTSSSTFPTTVISSSSSPTTLTSSSNSPMTTTLPPSSSTSPNSSTLLTSSSNSPTTTILSSSSPTTPSLSSSSSTSSTLPPSSSILPTSLSTSPTTVTSSSSSSTTPISSSSLSTTLISSSASPMTTLSSSSLSTMIITTASTMITTAISTTTTQASEKPRTKCPPKESTEIARIAHPCLCNVYYECVNGVKINQICPDEMHFDYMREICDLPEKVNCVRPIRIVDILMGRCNKCSPEGKAFQHESDCSSYYLCSNGTKILKHCKAGLHFNVTLQMCDYPTTECNLIPKFLTTAKFLTAHSVSLGDCPPAGCTEKVLLPHECKCDQYYECVNERKALRYCEDGLHFDHNRNTCSHPNDAKCPYVCPCTTEKILLPHEYNCEQYYECVNREQVLRTCPDNQHFDYINKTCKHPDEAICATFNSTTTAKTTTETTITETTTTEITTTETPITTTPTTTTTENIPEKPRKTCPPAGSTEKARIAHPWICIWYYECVNGKPKFRTCNILKLEAFDYIREECVFFWEAKCRWPISTYDILIDDYNNKCSQEGRAFWHKTDSSLYYLCVNGKKILKHCPAGLRFNVTLQMCDYPTKTDGDLTSKFLTTAKFLTAHSVSLKDCPPAGSTEKILLPHECKCDQYYECVNAKQILRNCEDGLHFDHNRNTCSHPNDAKCPYVCPCVSEKILLPHECNCEQYYECVNRKQALRTCLNNQHFDYIDKICKHSDEANCAILNSTTTMTTTTEITTTEMTTTTETTTTETTTTETTTTEMTTTEMTPTTETTTTETTTTETTTTETPITTTPTTTETPITTTPTTTETPITTTPTTTTENISEKPRKTCPPPGSTEIARIADPIVCNKYYECINGEKIQQKCSNGMEFDYIREVCDWYWIVKCIRPIPTYDIFTSKSIISIKWPEETYKTATNNLDPATCIGTCPEVDPPVAVLLPNEDCKKFCMCSNGIAWVQSCPEPLYFDSIDKVCKYKKDAVCGKRLFNQDHVSMLHKKIDDENSMQSLNNKNNDEQDNSWSTVRIYNLDPVTCIGICPEEDPPFAVLLPNEDCKKFCMCSNGIAWVQSCPEPLYFDSKDKICKNKRDAVCAKRLFYQDHASMLHKKIDDENSMQSLNNKNNDEQDNSWSTIRIYNLDPVTCIGICPEEDPPFAVLLPNEDCKKFCMCSNGIAWVQSCPEPLYFDSKDKICKNKRDAVCAKRLFYQDRASMLHRIVDDENSMQSLNNKNNDEQEIHENSWSTVRIYNLDPVTCIGTCPEEDPPFAVLLPNEDCKKFCMCSNGIAWVQSCPEPLYFDSKDKICKNKRDAVCAVRPFN